MGPKGSYCLFFFFFLMQKHLFKYFPPQRKERLVHSRAGGLLGSDWLGVYKAWQCACNGGTVVSTDAF